MAVKGLGYIKTSWAFEERPLSSSKLNLWDDRVEDALELLYFLMSHAWGGGDGVVRGATETDLEVVSTETPGMSVLVESGYAFMSQLPFKLASTTETIDVAAPTTNPRIDLVQARLETWDISVKGGAEAVAPTAPEPDEDCLALAELDLRAGMTSIEDTDDSVNGYITDVRTYL